MAMEPRESEYAVVMRGVSRRLNSGQALLEDIHLRVRRGELLHIVGPSGSGKTSLIRLINRLDEASTGSVEVLGQPIQDWPIRDLRQNVGMMFQEPTLLGLNVRENLELALQLSPSEGVQESFEEVMRLADVEFHLLDRYESELSVGQKQRVTLARALIHQPDLLLLDEPTAAQDLRTAERLLNHLSELQQNRDLTIVMVTHRLNEAIQMGGRMIVLMKGRAETIDDVARLTRNPPKGAVREFLLGEPDHD
ncbi:MAG: ATP-binding cassette domain-containing protein [Planctomycetota bacterium]